MKKTTASKQFLGDAKAAYAEALQKLSDVPADDQTLSLVATLHSNLAAVFLAQLPPSYMEAKAAAEIALSVPYGAHRVKASERKTATKLTMNNLVLFKAPFLGIWIFFSFLFSLLVRRSRHLRPRNGCLRTRNRHLTTQTGTKKIKRSKPALKRPNRHITVGLGELCLK